MHSAISYLTYPGLPEAQIRLNRLQSINEKIQQVIKIVCNHYSLDIAIVNSMTRKKPCAECRHVIFYMLYKYKLGTTTSIGELFNRDHSTIIQGMKQLSNWNDTEEKLRHDLDDIDKMVNEIMQ